MNCINVKVYIILDYVMTHKYLTYVSAFIYYKYK